MHEEMIGFKTGILTVIEFSHLGISPNGKHYKCWKAQCECGKTRIISTGELKRGRTSVPSCGCYRELNDLTGKKFHSLTVIRLHGKKKYQYYWLCQCDCGNEKVIRGECLTRMITKTCGCLLHPSESNYIEIIKKRIKENIKVNENNCWEWTGFIKPSGY